MLMVIQLTMSITFSCCILVPLTFKRGSCYLFVREELENNTVVDHR